MAALLGVGCGDTSPEPSQDAILVGAALPFTGKAAAVGRNLEQAMLLAAEDVNRAGGVAGKPLRVATCDTNSGSERGLQDLLGLLYVEQVAYLVGPEENELATAIVPDVKGLDVLNILPGYAAPGIERVGSRGAWLRLAPSATAVGCALAKQAIESGIETANAVVAVDDYNLTLAAEFSAHFAHAGGQSLPSVSVQAGSHSFSAQVSQALGYGADRTLLIAYPATASVIVTDWAVAGMRGSWFFPPMLYTEEFLLNVPFGSVDGYPGLSPSLSLRTECRATDPPICERANAQRFEAHFARRWNGDTPIPAAHFYYDAVVLLAMGLNYLSSQASARPSAVELQRTIRQLNAPELEPISWEELGPALSDLRQGRALRYVGAAAEYEFDQYGAAQHTVFDTWTIERSAFVNTGPLMAHCPRNL